MPHLYSADRTVLYRYNDGPSDWDEHHLLQIELILSVRDDVRPNLMGHHYNDREQFYQRYKDEAYSWVEKSRKDD